jgi:hypothetical protein
MMQALFSTASLRSRSAIVSILISAAVATPARSAIGRRLRKVSAK